MEGRVEVRVDKRCRWRGGEGGGEGGGGPESRGAYLRCSMVPLSCSWAGDRSGGPCGWRERSPEKLGSQLKAGRGRGDKLGS